MFKKKRVDLAGSDGSYGEIVRDDDSQVSYISLFLAAELPTKRSRGFTRLSSIHAGHAIKAEQQKWFLRICALGQARMAIHELQRQSIANGVRVSIDVDVVRLRRMKDKKNLFVAVDEFIIDGLVRMNVLFDDTEGNIELNCKQTGRSPYYLDNGPYVHLMFMQDKFPCSKGMKARLKKEIAESKSTKTTRKQFGSKFSERIKMSRPDFKRKILEADNLECQNPWHENKNDPFHTLLDAHHLLGMKHEDIAEGITLCRVCHEKCESGFSFDADDGCGGITKGRTSGREYEISILEHIRDNRPDHFRFEAVLNQFYKKRKVV